MKAETRAMAWLIFMLALGTLMTILWATSGAGMVQQIVRMLPF
jgi:hypothetical protein